MNITSLITNKQILLALGMIVFVGAVVASGTGAFFSDSASATANTFKAGTLALKIAKDSNGTPVNGWLDSQDAAWNFTAMVPGGAPEESSVWLKNDGSIDGMSLGVDLDNASETVSGMGPLLRIASMTLDGDSLLEGGAGHNFALYEAPTACDIEVRFGNNDYDTVSEAVNAATAGQVICVAAGNYTDSWETSNGGTSYPLRIDADNVTLVSVDGPDTTTLGGGVILDNDGTSVSGFTIQDSSLLGDTFAVYINSGVDNAEVSFNDLSGPGNTGRGVVTALGTVANATIANNDSHDWATGIYLNDSSTMTVEYNTLQNNTVGISNDHPAANIVRLNQITDNSFEGVGVLLDTGNSITLEMNNIFGNGTDVAHYGVGTLVAENNWWGDFDPSDQTSGSVDAEPFAGGPFAGFVNGTDFNNNGYADLQDLNNDPILDAGVGLDGGEQKLFEMAVQLDGPSTDNSYQAASYTTDVVFTLNQI